MTVKDETGSSGNEHRNKDMWENEETQRDLLTHTLRPSLENTVISFPEEIALHRTNLQLHSDVGGEFQRQIIVKTDDTIHAHQEGMKGLLTYTIEGSGGAGQASPAGPNQPGTARDGD